MEGPLKDHHCWAAPLPALHMEAWSTTGEDACTFPRTAYNDALQDLTTTAASCCPEGFKIAGHEASRCMEEKKRCCRTSVAGPCTEAEPTGASSELQLLQQSGTAVS